MKITMSVYQKLFLSFLVILGIPMVISTILYVYIGQRLRNQSDNLNQNLLEVVQADLDYMVDSVKKDANKIYMDENLSLLARVQGSMGPQHALSLYYLYQSLDNITIISDFVSDIMVYFDMTDKVVSTSGNMDLERYYEYYVDHEILTLEEFRDFLSGEFHYDLMIVPDHAGGQTILVLLSLNLIGKSGKATIMMQTDEKAVQNLISADRMGDENEIVVISQNGGVITRENSSISPDKEFVYEDYTEGISEGTDILGEKSRVTVLDSAIASWKYLLITPLTSIYRDMSRIRLYFTGGLLFCLFLGFIMSYYLTGRNYNPFRQVIETLLKRNPEGQAVEGNEFQWLNAQVERLFQNAEQRERLLEENRQHMREYRLYELLNKDCSDFDPQQLQLTLPGPYYGVVLLRIYNEIDNDTNLNHAFRLFVIHNILSELIQKCYPAEVFIWEDSIAAVISFPREGGDQLTLIREQIENMQSIVRGPLQCKPAALMGCIREGLSGVHASYEDAREIEEYIHLLDTDLLLYSDVENTESKYEYSSEMEEKIVNALSVGAEEEARRLIREVFEKNREQRISVDLYWCLVYEIVGTLLKGANKGMFKNAARELDLPDAVTRCNPGAEVQDAIADIIHKICVYIQENQKLTSGEHALSMELEAFIQKHFQDPDLNISTMSQSFNKTAAYLSSIYKKQTGGSLLDYINTARIDFAEKLLEEGATVAEAAEKSGFRDSGNLIRAFKKKKGITPGQVKKRV